MAATSYKIRGIEPPDLGRYPTETRKLFWGWVVELGLRAKGKEILAGLDKDGKPLKAIKQATRDHRKSAMSPSGKGDPSAPPLIPAWQKSRTYSLLAGRAVSTHAEFFWRYDVWTGESWGDVLAYQAKQGRNVIGISVAAVAKVKVQSWAKWDSWKAGLVREIAATKGRQHAVPQIGRYAVDHAELGATASGGSAQGVTFLPGRSTGWTTPAQRAAYRRETASAKLPGRPENPAARSPISGPRYNRLIAHTWNQGSGRGGTGTAAPGPPRPGPRITPPKPERRPAPKPVPKPTPKPPASKPAPKPPAPPGRRFNDLADVQKWAEKTFPKAEHIQLGGIPLESWQVIADEIDYHVKKTPALAERMYAFGAQVMDKNDIAAAIPGSGRGCSSIRPPGRI